MEKIAFIIGETFIYWSSIILTLAVITAVFLFWSLYLNKSGNAVAAALFVPPAIVGSMYCARFIHWYCFTDSYNSLEAAMADMSRGGFALMGVFAACIAVACLLRLVRIVKDLPQMLDCMALAGGVGIAVGRLSCLFNTADRGMNIETLRGLPLVSEVTNAVSGVTEYRLATFMLQSMITALIVLILWRYSHKANRKGLRSGDIALLFSSAYGAAQIVLDSTRYDSMFMRSNGFISIVQILGLVGLLIPIILFSIRMVKAGGFLKRFLLLWIPMVACMGLAAFMEYWVQRHGDQALFSYSVMSACLLVTVVLTASIRYVAVRRESQMAQNT